MMEAGKVDLIDDGHELAWGLHLTLLPGPTMGQMGLRIDRPDGRAILVWRHGASPMQIFQPGVSTSSYDDPSRAAETRQILLEEASATRRLVVPSQLRGWRRTYVRELAPFTRRSSGMIRDKAVAAPNGWRWAGAADCCRGAGPRPPTTDLQMSATGLGRVKTPAPAARAPSKGGDEAVSG
jgi:hypothetical protein